MRPSVPHVWDRNLSAIPQNTPVLVTTELGQVLGAIRIGRTWRHWIGTSNGNAPVAVNIRAVAWMLMPSPFSVTRKRTLVGDPS
jgi:hypothetical protein